MRHGRSLPDVVRKLYRHVCSPGQGIGRRQAGYPQFRLCLSTRGRY